MRCEKPQSEQLSLLPVFGTAWCLYTSGLPTQIFSSFEAYFDANQHASLRATVLGSDDGNWVLTHLNVSSLSIQWGQAGANVVVEGAPKPGGVSIFIPTQRSSWISGNGRWFDDCSLMAVGPGDEFCLAADASRRWCSLYIPNEKLADANGDAAAAYSSMHGLFQLPFQRIERFRLAVGQFDEAVQQAPDSFKSAAAQNAAEQKLLREIRNVLAEPHEVEHSIGRHEIPRRQLIRTSMDFVDQHDGEYLSVEQVATAAGVSERTLRNAFQQSFGVAPARYLKRRTLHQVRRALKAADPSVATVTDIATQFGVWQFGQLARDYRLLFGELPSETLHHRH